MKVLYAFDWNAHPQNPDRYRPRWLADRAGLTIRHAGRGSFGNIDYPMADARLSALERQGRYGSDHDLVTFTVRQGLQLLRGGTWNALDDRDPIQVAAAIVRMFEDHDLDFLCVQEAADYHRAIRLRGLYVTPGTAAHGSRESVVVVRQGVDWDDPAVWRLSRRGWPLSRSVTHAPAYAAAVTVDGWLRVVSGHLPNYERSWRHARAYRQAARRLLRRARRIRGA